MSKIAPAASVASQAWESLRSLVHRRLPRLWGILRLWKQIALDMRGQWRQGGFGSIKRPWRHAMWQMSLPPARPKSSRVWLDLGEFGELIDFSQWTLQDHGLGLLRTILHQKAVYTDLASMRTARDWDAVARQLKGYSMLFMNVRSYNYKHAAKAAQLFKQLNPKGLVLVGGMHTSVSLAEMEQVDAFDKICVGPGENVIAELAAKPEAFPRVFQGEGARSMTEWPAIDRTLWPKPASLPLSYKYCWPLEPGLDWSPRPVGTILTSRVCPWQCSFCNENSYIPNMGRRSVEAVIDELNEMDEKYGMQSVVIHDSMFFQNPSWLQEWLKVYPKRARRLWPYWAAGRADTVCEWPELFERLIRETNWNMVSIGFESGSDAMLRMLNKQVTERENLFVIDLLNRIGNEQEAAGEEPVKIWSNIMFGIPGEKPEDAVKTVRMVKRMKRATLALAFYSPYPGSALGDQLIAEGKNLMPGNHERNHRDEKVKGIDYGFYRGLFAGKYDGWVNEGLDHAEQERPIMVRGGVQLADLVPEA